MSIAGGGDVFSDGRYLQCIIDGVARQHALRPGGIVEVFVLWTGAGDYDDIGLSRSKLETTGICITALHLELLVHGKSVGGRLTVFAVLDADRNVFDRL